METGHLGSPFASLVNNLHCRALYTSGTRGARIAFTFILLVFSLLPKRKQFDLGLQGVGQENAAGSQSKSARKLLERGGAAPGCIFPKR